MMAANLYFSQIEDLMFEVLQYKKFFPYMLRAATLFVPWC